MRVDSGGPGDRWFRLGVAGAGSAAGLLFGLPLGWPGAAAGAGAGLAVGALIGAATGRRRSRRRRLLATPAPPERQSRLRELWHHYARLPEDLRRRFDDDLRVFLAEKRISGVEVDPDGELGLLVAASAVSLSVGWPDFEWDALTEVLLYPDDFDCDYGFDEADRAGETHPWGTVVLSVPALRDSFSEPGPFHVGIHEFAHLLDVERSEFYGSGGMAGPELEAWLELREREMGRLLRGDSVLDEYGADDPVEFFAVAVESFFQQPDRLRRGHSALYGTLSRYFRQDPAAWTTAPLPGRRGRHRRSRPRRARARARP